MADETRSQAEQAGKDGADPQASAVPAGKPAAAAAEAAAPAKPEARKKSAAPARAGAEAVRKPVAGKADKAKAPAAAARPRPKPKPKAPPEPPRAPEDQAPPDDMEIPAMVTAVQNGVSGAVRKVTFWVGDWTVVVAADRLLDVMRFLKDDAATAFDYCSDVTAADWPPREKRFDVIYCLYSTRLRHRLRVKVRVGEEDPVESVTQLWPAADWLEREVYDQFGIDIVNHPDLRRILMPEQWQGHPQRKDYPLEGPGELLMENPQDWLRVRNLPDEVGAGVDTDAEIE